MGGAVMGRSFDAASLVALPMLDVPTAIAVGEELVTRAKEEKLKGPSADAAKKLKQAVVELTRAARSRLSSSDEDAKRTAHREIGNAFRSLHDWLNGWVQLSEQRGGE